MTNQCVLPETTLREIYHGVAHSAKDIPTTISPVGILWANNPVVQMYDTDEQMPPELDIADADAASAASPRTPTNVAGDGTDVAMDSTEVAASKAKTEVKEEVKEEAKEEAADSLPTHGAAPRGMNLALSMKLPRWEVLNRMGSLRGLSRTRRGRSALLSRTWSRGSRPRSRAPTT